MNAVHMRCLAGLAAASLAAATHAGFAQYQIDVLPDLGFGANGWDLNEAGHVAGAVFDDRFNRQAVLWDGGAEPVFITPGEFGGARALNDAGQVAGEFDLSGSSPFLWSPALTQPIMTEFDNTRVQAMNDAGTVVGAADNQAAVWSASQGTRTLAFSDDGGFGSANDISNSGYVVGAAPVSDGGPFPATRAFRYDDADGMVELGTLGGSFSEAFGVNDQGDVVGLSSTADGADAPFLFSDGTMTNLGLSEGVFSGRAVAINNLGQVVGIEGGGFAGPATAWLWDDGERVFLDQLVDLDPNIQITDVLDINDNGEILVRLQNSATFQSSSAVLRVIPSPGPAAFGLGAFAVAAVRRRR